jgi:DNA-binding transcriptional MerR regulator
MSAHVGERSYRIGEVAERVGVTTRSIGDYEELGVRGGGTGRTKGAHRLYSDTDVARLQELVRLRDLLGLSLEELITLADDARVQQCLRDRWEATSEDAERVRIIEAAMPIRQRQLELVRQQQRRLAEFEAELSEKLELMHRRLREFGADIPASPPASPDSGPENGNPSGEAGVRGDRRASR